MPPRKRSPQHTGIEVRHEQRCRTRADSDAGCNCRPSYRGSVRHGRNRLIRGKWTRSLAEARSWRVQTLAKVDAGNVPQQARETFAEAAEAWLEGAKAGTIRNRNGEVYKPSAIRGYEQVFNARAIPVFGRARLSAITKPELQRWVKTLLEDGLSSSTVRNTINGARVVFRQAVDDGVMTENPTIGLKLPAVRRSERKFVTADTARMMLDVLPIRDRAIWACAFYAGLRRGELWGLRYGDVDRTEGIIRVRNSEDPMEGRIDPKSVAGLRPVPISNALASILDEYDDYLCDRLGRPLREDDRYFPGDRSERFSDRGLSNRSAPLWEAAGLEPIGLHSARHTFASYLIAAGVNPKAIQTYMGHSSIQVTYDIYGHLFPGNEAEAAALLDAYLRQDGAAAGLAGRV